MRVKAWMKAYKDIGGNQADIPETTMPAILQERAAKYPDHKALSFFGRQFTYRELAGASYGFAASLQKSGVKKGDRVAIMLPNCPQYVISYYGALAAGAIVTQVNPMTVGRELEYLLNDSGAETIIALDAFCERIDAVRSSAGLKNVIAVSLQPENKTAAADHGFDDFLASGGGSYRHVEIEPAEDVAVLQYTGGTTGRAKGAMLTHRNIVANVVQSYEFFKEDTKIGQERVLTVIPLFHVFGMTAAMNYSVYTANDAILLPRFELEEVLRTIKKERPTIFPGVPTMYVAITSHPNAEEYGIDSIRVCNSGSAPMPVELLKEFERKTGSTIYEGYGLSEAAPVTHCNPMFAERKPGSVGICLPLTDCRIVDLAGTGKDAAEGELGELIVKGPQVMKGYWNMPDETEAALKDGWLYTGDICRLDPDGYLYVADRKKDLIIASGYNVYPRDVEEVLYEHPSVQEAVVIGVPDEYRGEAIKAIIVCRAGHPEDAEDILSFCRHNLSAYKIPSYVEFRKELPKTIVGKILRRALREETVRK